MKVVTASTPWHSLNLEWARGVVGAHWISMAGKKNVLFLSAILLPTLTSAIKPLKEKLLVHLCKSINGNLGEREVMC